MEKSKQEKEGGFLVSDTVSVDGTSLHGYLDTTFDSLVKVFGPPNFDDISSDDKVKIEWDIKFNDGTVATIYDYKNYEMSNDEVKEKNKDWHIGGHSDDSLKEVVRKMEKSKVAFGCLYI